MTDKSNTAAITSASISDRGLSDKRPLNEDSYLADESHCIFVVADGVGGAQAGEVASKTAVEVLDEAFRHQEIGGDVEDLLEIAIQRANASIHQMAREHPKLSMMATTVVALHLDNYTATIGHVGDSRLYRLTPDGKLLRETADHSMVEEEVRAGRMTPDQAANHPSRNIISRALGAEAAVDVDTKAIEIEDGTAFLLCSDGITRHISDDEIRRLLGGGKDLNATCEEMKRICYERGAEDNLTAVIIRVGDFKAAAKEIANDAAQDDDPTLAMPRAAAASARSSAMDSPAHSDGDGNTTPTIRVSNNNLDSQNPASKPTSRQVISLEPEASDKEQKTIREPKPRSLAGTLALLLTVAAVTAAAAFYGGMTYRDQQHKQLASESVAATSATVQESPEAKYEKLRREVDRSPQSCVARMTNEAGGKPLESADPEFLYLYGRALMLSGKHAEAGEAFKKTIDKLNASAATNRDPLKVEARISAAATALQSRNASAQATAAKDLDEVIQTENATGAMQPAAASNATGTTPVR